ncbi:MAG: hypothetical protein NTZ57_09200 [Deltaproteobacteria bacterium]|jgi:hypothetical protein|nr:hypothetical protein [Deltaproteobacteria bacterium]
MVKEQKSTREEMDKRLLENKLRQGLMSKKKLSEYLATLPDLSANAEEVVVVIEERK